jgi:Fe2+ transport system protein FeoA
MRKTFQEEVDDDCEESVNYGRCCNLDEVPSGTLVEVVAVKPDGRSARRLAELGFTPSTPIEVLQAEPGQPMLLRVRRARLAVNRAVAGQIEVRVLHGRRARRKKRHGRRDRRRWWRLSRDRRDASG